MKALVSTICITPQFVIGDYLRVFVFGKGSDRQAIEKEVEKMKRGQS